MTDNPTPADFDDQLLSAYLDDELSAEERARVEERLASDPAARQMVEQLRAVSRTVQGLPRESVGEDLRGAVLQRAERAMLASSPPRLHDPAADNDQPMPRLTIGRSPRGWIWAGLAVAAALAIMVYQREQKHGGNLPDVAVARRAGDSLGRRAGEVPEMRARPEQPAPAVASAGDSSPRDSLTVEESVRHAPAAAPATATPPAAAVTESLAAGADRAARSNLGFQPSTASPAAADRLAGGVGGAAPATGRVAMERQPTTEEDSFAAAGVENDLVVYLNVRPAALRSQAFDRLLVSNGIVVEPPADDDHSAITSGETTAGGSAAMADASGKPASVEQNVDAVLVDAPAAQIEQCLTAIDADKHNYLGVVIDETSARDKLPARKLAAERNWQQYNRGRVPQQQQVQLGGNFKQSVNLFGYSDRGAQMAKGVQVLSDRGDNLSSPGGRAVRIEAPQSGDRQMIDQLRQRELATSRGKASDSLRTGAARADTDARVDAAPDRLQVLFLLSAEPASSPPAPDSVP